jgi:hypothetical protein
MTACAPEIIYILFSLIQIIIDVLDGLYNSAGIKTIISIIVVAVLHVLCQKGLLLISWIIVLTPLLFMAFTASVLLYALNLNPKLGKSCDNNEPYIETTILNNPRYKHGYDHLYKYTTTPVEMHFQPIWPCDKYVKEQEDVPSVKGPTKVKKVRIKSKYLVDSDPSYESFSF